MLKYIRHILYVNEWILYCQYYILCHITCPRWKHSGISPHISKVPENENREGKPSPWLVKDSYHKILLNKRCMMSSLLQSWLASLMKYLLLHICSLSSWLLRRFESEINCIILWNRITKWFQMLVQTKHHQHLSQYQPAVTPRCNITQKIPSVSEEYTTSIYSYST